MASWEIHNACADVKVMDRTTADVAVVPKRKKVAIVGFATNTLHLVPWFDPEFEIWGLNQGYMNFQRRGDRWFEMHLPEATADVRDPNYLQWLHDCPIPVYMIQCYDEIPNSVRYPIEDALRLANRDYFTSSIAFMLALAELEDMREIHIYGVNLSIGDEWFYEKACAEYWIGRLEAQGRKVYIPSASSLLKQHRRYGYSIDARPAQSLKILAENRINELRAQAEQQAGALNASIGAMRELQGMLQIFEGVDHGSDVVLIPANTQLGQAPKAITT